MNAPTTQRAYTMRLTGLNEKDEPWRDALWQTHELVNKGAKAFGEWLLTFRGGLSSKLAEESYGKNKQAIDEGEKKRRKIFLALSWLSVESKNGAPEKYIIASGSDDTDVRRRNLREALREILKSEGLSKSAIEDWLDVCDASISAPIRDDAVWVNRNAAFRDACSDAKERGLSIRTDDINDFLDAFFKNTAAYFAPASIEDNDEEALDEETTREKEEKQKELVKNAGGWLSERFGLGTGAHFATIASVYKKISQWDPTREEMKSREACLKSLAHHLKLKPESYHANAILQLISGRGHKSATRNIIKELFDATSTKKTISGDDIKKLKESAAEDEKKCTSKIGNKGFRDYALYILNDIERTIGCTYQSGANGNNLSILNAISTGKNKIGTSRHKQFSVMLDHAARRVSVAHTWMKRAEALREKLKRDLAKLNDIPEQVKNILQNYCITRAQASGALGEFRISKRAVDGWKDIVKAWNTKECVSKDDRIAKIKQLQDELPKFGDEMLFETLAEDDAVCVWKKENDEVEPSYLIDFARASEAERKKRQYKVPAYRHPDALLHPVFCDFGESRWEIAYDVHKNPATTTPNRIIMEVWNGQQIVKMPLRWQSKRLQSEIISVSKNQNDGSSKEVSRVSRFCTAIFGGEDTRFRIGMVFDEKYWNGRLQAPRVQLEKIAKIRDNTSLSQKIKEQKIERCVKNIKWLVTFSPKLLCQGPWHTYRENNSGYFEENKYVPFAKENASRGTHAKLILCRLPHLRILSVDLGHRSAASCAVWETLSSKDMQNECKSANVEPPDSKSLYFYVTNNNKSTVYRRIGPDVRANGKEHPASWARLERQFTIKVQGEESETRETSNEEIWKVHGFETWCGVRMPLIEALCLNGYGKTEKQKKRLEELKKLGWKEAEIAADDGSDSQNDYESYHQSLSVDDLMSKTVRTMRLALRRHGDRARIAFAMMSDYKHIPGERKYYFLKPKDASQNDSSDVRKKKYLEHLVEQLQSWYALFRSPVWKDDESRQLWERYIAPHIEAADLKNCAEEDSRKDTDERLRKQLLSAAEKLADDLELRRQISEAFRQRWENDDEMWRQYLKWFRKWILPGNVKKCASIMKAGGLSINRIATITEFRRKVQVGFHTRLHPDGSRTTVHEGFAQKTLDALERLREQRIKQLASRIVEAALGIGSENPSHWEDNKKRPRARIEKPEYAPCHAIVIENLTHYRPEQSRTRRENRQLMNWAAANVKKYLAEQCELHGLFLREITASFTSRQDSRTGAPGMRCVEVPVQHFLTSRWWQKQIEKAENKVSQGKGNARDRYLVKVKEFASQNQGSNKAIVIPVNGGEIFISADEKSPIAGGINADINAAANIGLRALMDPDWEGKWWYITCDYESLIPDAELVKGCAIIQRQKPLKKGVSSDKAEEKSPARKRAAQSKEGRKVNLWRDVTADSLYDKSGWKDYASYWNIVQYRVIQNLMERYKISDSP